MLDLFLFKLNLAESTEKKHQFGFECGKNGNILSLLYVIKEV